MNAGYVPLEHWTQGPEGGGRNLGEACHIYDLFNYLTQSEVTRIQAAATAPKSKQWAQNDNFVVVISYANGSVCTLTYTAMGCKSYSKEQMEFFADGLVVSMNDYKALTVTGGTRAGWKANSPQKGQLEELQVVAKAIHTGGEWPISLKEQIEATRISLEVERQIRRPKAGEVTGVRESCAE